jgi:hypothetical protein
VPSVQITNAPEDVHRVLGRIWEPPSNVTPYDPAAADRRLARAPGCDCALERLG